MSRYAITIDGKLRGPDGKEVPSHEVVRILNERADAEEWEAVARGLAERVKSAEAREKELSDALEPFAKFASKLHLMGGTFPKEGSFYGLLLQTPDEVCLTIEDLKRAGGSRRSNAQ